MAKEAHNPAPHPTERRLWAEAVRDVTPLRGRAAPVLPAAANEPPPSLANLEIASDPGLVERFAEAFAGVDRANSERLKRGRHPIEARLDLHGLTQTEAHRALMDFVEGCWTAGQRCVLVITGRGLGPDGPGVLKSAVPRWLAEAGLRRRILAIAAAQPRHGGAGALYLLLRRERCRQPHPRTRQS
jgi:DNA-nicking Smr family endonuclease